MAAARCWAGVMGDPRPSMRCTAAVGEKALGAGEAALPSAPRPRAKATSPCTQLLPAVVRCAPRWGVVEEEVCTARPTRPGESSPDTEGEPVEATARVPGCTDRVLGPVWSVQAGPAMPSICPRALRADGVRAGPGASRAAWDFFSCHRSTSAVGNVDGSNIVDGGWGAAAVDTCRPPRLGGFLPVAATWLEVAISGAALESFCESATTAGV